MLLRSLSDNTQPGNSQTFIKTLEHIFLTFYAVIFRGGQTAFDVHIFALKSTNLPDKQKRTQSPAKLRAFLFQNAKINEGTRFKEFCPLFLFLT